jgi:hypothetical protein
MTKKEIAKRLTAAEKAEEWWDRRVLVSVHKMRYYRKRAKYYREKLGAYPAAEISHRVRRKIALVEENKG